MQLTPAESETKTQSAPSDRFQAKMMTALKSFGSNPRTQFFLTEIWGRPGRRFFALVMVPTLTIFLYTAFWASPMYISSSMFAIKSLESGGDFGGMSGSLTQLMGVSNSTTGDSYLISNYVKSWDLFSKVDSRLDLRGHFGDRSKDIISRLPQNSAQADIIDYWEWVVGLSFDPDTGIIRCKVKAYSPEMAWKINQAIIEYSEALINDMNRRGRQDTLALAASEVGRAEDRLTKAHAAVRGMREKTTMLSPQSESETLHSVISTLEAEAAKTAAELKEAEAYMRPDSPVVSNLKRKLEALSNQLAAERGKLSGLTEGSERRNWEYLSTVLGQFEDLQLEEEFARQQYSSAMSALEGARIRSESKNRYLVAFEPPLLPDESLYPKVVRATAITFLGATLILGLISLTIAAIREHAGF